MLCYLPVRSTSPLSAAATGGVVLLDTEHVVLPASWVYKSPVSCCYVVLCYWIQSMLCYLPVRPTGPLSAAATGGVVLLDTEHVVLPAS